MNITYTPADKRISKKSRMSNYDAAVSRDMLQDSNILHNRKNDYKNSRMFNDNEVEKLSVIRFWSTFLTLFVISVITAWIYVTIEGGLLDFSSIFVGTILLTFPASLLHTGYFKNKISH